VGGRVEERRVGRSVLHGGNLVYMRAELEDAFITGGIDLSKPSNQYNNHNGIKEVRDHGNLKT